MRSSLPAIASQIGADPRTLRRAAARGAVRCRRPGPRSLELPPGELAYLRSHWQLINTLTGALRTERNVELAVLYGSAARGSDAAASDIDVLVQFRDDERGSTAALARRLEERVGKPVDVARLSRVRREAPFLLLQVLDQGRVLVDRSDAWPELRRHRETVARAARRQLVRSRREAADSLAALVRDD